jgi:hypothetical protein
MREHLVILQRLQERETVAYVADPPDQIQPLQVIARATCNCVHSRVSPQVS